MAAPNHNQATFTLQDIFHMQYLGTDQRWDRQRAEAWLDAKQNMIRAANLHPGQRVLDLACGIGLLGRLAGEIVGPENVAYCDKDDEALTTVSQDHIAKFSAPRLAPVAAPLTINADWTLPREREALRQRLAHANFQPHVVIAGEFLHYFVPRDRPAVLQTLLELAPVVVFDYYEQGPTDSDPEPRIYEHTPLPWGVRHVNHLGQGYQVRLNSTANRATYLQWISMETRLTVPRFHLYAEPADFHRVEAQARELVRGAGARLVGNQVWPLFDDTLPQQRTSSRPDTGSLDDIFERRCERSVRRWRQERDNAHGSAVWVNELRVGTIVVAAR